MPGKISGPRIEIFRRVYQLREENLLCITMKARSRANSILQETDTIALRGAGGEGAAEGGPPSLHLDTAGN